MNAWGKACAICAVAMIVVAAAYVVASSLAGTYALFSDSERVPASVAAALDFGPAPATVGVDPDTVNPTIPPSTATPTPDQTATPEPTVALTPTASATAAPTTSPTPSATPVPAPGGIYVSVTCQGQPVAGAQVRVSHQSPGEPVVWSGGTGDDGELSTGLVLNAGSYLVDIVKQGASYDSVIAAVPAGGYAPVYAQCTALWGTGYRDW
jgi:hypothetical protein